MERFRMFVLCRSNEDEAQETERRPIYDFLGVNTLHKRWDDTAPSYYVVQSKSPAACLFYATPALDFSNNDEQESPFSVIAVKSATEKEHPYDGQCAASFFGSLMTAGRTFVFSLWMSTLAYLQLNLRTMLALFTRYLRSRVCRRDRSINDHGKVTHSGSRRITIRGFRLFRNTITRFSGRVVSQAGILSWFKRRFTAFYEVGSGAVFTRVLKTSHHIVRMNLSGLALASIRRLATVPPGCPAAWQFRLQRLRRIMVRSFCGDNYNITTGRLLTYRVGRVARC